MQVRILVTMAWTSWTNRAADAPLPAADFDARFSRIVERVTREIDPAKAGVFRGVFDESLNPPNPKGHLYVVCEAYASPHNERLTYVGRMLGSAAARTARRRSPTGSRRGVRRVVRSSISRAPTRATSAASDRFWSSIPTTRSRPRRSGGRRVGRRASRSIRPWTIYSVGTC